MSGARATWALIKCGFSTRRDSRVFGRDPAGCGSSAKDVGRAVRPARARDHYQWLMDGPDGGWTPSGGFGDVSWEDGRASWLWERPILQGPSVRFAAESIRAAHRHVFGP